MELVVLTLRVVHILEPLSVCVLLLLRVDSSMELKVITTAVEFCHFIIELEKPGGTAPVHFYEANLPVEIHCAVLFNVEV